MGITLALSSHFIAHSLSPISTILINGMLRAEHIALTHHSRRLRKIQQIAKCVRERECVRVRMPYASHCSHSEIDIILHIIMTIDANAYESSFFLFFYFIFAPCVAYAFVDLFFYFHSTLLRLRHHLLRCHCERERESSSLCNLLRLPSCILRHVMRSNRRATTDNCRQFFFSCSEEAARVLAICFYYHLLLLLCICCTFVARDYFMSANEPRTNATDCDCTVLNPREKQLVEKNDKQTKKIVCTKRTRINHFLLL